MTCEMQKYLNKRVLYEIDHSYTRYNPKEGVVKEISLGKKFIKIDSNWYDISEVMILDQLESI